ncbi:hypothetical protein RhiJN_04500 [Ceratobasidium sp. AG-Ba]|nr:hypothetical protein RhiJN_04500 [Ceratobasidium sp. AG-Ba]QRW05391.1 hypothetical protein RhiLY_04390 [Ceratobasidium sp. AG-Ba]
MAVPTDEKPSHASASDPMSPTSKTSSTPKSSPAAKDAPLTKAATVSKGTQPKVTSPKNSPSKSAVPPPTVSGAAVQDGTKKVRRKGSKPIINWFQRKIAGRKPPPPNVPGLERGRDPRPRHQRGASHSRSVGPSNNRKRRSGITAGDADGEYSLGEGTSVRSRSLSPSLGPESMWSPSMQLEADDDASIRPLPPTSPPSPSPSNTTYLSQTTYSGYGSDPRTVGSHSVSTKPTTLLSVDIGLGGQPAHIAQAHTPAPAPTGPSPSSPQFGRFPSTRSAHQPISSGASVTFSPAPYPSSPLSTAPYFLADEEAQDPDASTQAPTHSLPHPRNNPRPASPPLDNASTLTLASSTFNMPRQVEADAISASVRAIRRRGSWESGDSRWSAVVGLRRPGSTRTAGSWRTGGSIGGGIMLDQQRVEDEYCSDEEDKHGEDDADSLKAENVPLPESPIKGHVGATTPLSIQTDLPVTVEANGARTSDDGPSTAVPGRKSLENGDETEKESNDGHVTPEAEEGNPVKGKKVDVVNAALSSLPE